ncbi:DUF1573 domain-containing protein [Pseudofulvibacter geojedonensis]|uniref:DUF1573 domain-containing protein n=1 Tax=Pseudofulvibacter geojedonensis TaxID=1123758 RepID=A0ABW3I5H2_9FLAO
MKKLLSLVVAITLFTSFSVTAQETEKKTPEKGAKIAFEQEVIDYGEVAYASNGEREFVIINEGDEPLIITRAKGSCGCTVPVAPKEPIMPGESATMKVRYDTKRGGQPFSKTITVYSNAVNTPTKVVKIKGKVLANPNKVTLKNAPATKAPATKAPAKAVN